MFKKVLPKEVAVYAARSILVSITSQAFNTASILEVLDTKCGGLNNVAVSEYARIETMLGHTTLKRGRHLLPYRNMLTKVRKTACSRGIQSGIHIYLDSSHVLIFLYLQNSAQPSDTNPFCGYNFVSGPSADTKSGVLYFLFSGYIRKNTKKILDLQLP